MSTKYINNFLPHSPSSFCYSLLAKSHLHYNYSAKQTPTSNMFNIPPVAKKALITLCWLVWITGMCLSMIGLFLGSQPPKHKGLLIISAIVLPCFTLGAGLLFAREYQRRRREPLRYS